ncbi:hypothetical protein C5167_026025 [Papaver somniferum]|nr:hypothetical protein C5167_026025 [Papaver somniferum]
MYKSEKEGSDKELQERVCIWTAFMLFVLAIFNARTIITIFTRIAGEIFGMLITVLFIQRPLRYQFQWICMNGLLGLIFTWHYGTGFIISLIADYRVPFMVLV